MNTVRPAQSRLARIANTIAPWIIVLALLAVPSLAFGQNPLEDSAAVKTGFLAFVDAWKWIIWAAAILGLIFFAVAKGLEGVLPDLYNGVRQWMRPAILTLIAVPLIIELLLAQIGG